MLEAFEERLRARPARPEATERADERPSAAGHAQHLWQQGYPQREAIREWRHLHVALLEELEAQFAQGNFDQEVMHAARLELALLVGDGVCESAAQYASLQKAEAVERVRVLEHALAALTQLEQRRAVGWLEAAHDLRGNVSVLTNASAVLDGNVGDGVRGQAFGLVQRGAASLQTLLTEIMDLARLEAGHEMRHIAPFDAGAMLRQLCESLRPAATERGLFLEAEGPEVLPVDGDAVKTQRIAQNLLLNALAYTERGGVRVTWEAAPTDGSARWELCIQDTGPGFEAEATSGITHRTGAAGSGVGLSIVKRLCELLDATLELETGAGHGTTFRVKLPSAYSTKS